MALTGCCGCFDLRRGAMAIGITYLVLCSLFLVVSLAVTFSVILAYHKHSVDFDHYHLETDNASFVNNSSSENHHPLAYNASFAGDYDSDFNRSRADNASVAVDIFSGDGAHPYSGFMLVVSRPKMDIVLLAIHLAFNSLLVCGAKRDNTCMLLTWLIYDGIVQAAHSAFFMTAFVMGCMSGFPPMAVAGAVALALTTVFWYWFAVVLQFYRMLRQPPGQTTLALGKVGPDE